MAGSYHLLTLFTLPIIATITSKANIYVCYRVVLQQYGCYENLIFDDPVGWIYFWHQGDVVLALSKTPGRGWVMGAVAGRQEGRYTIIFADGSKEEGIR